MYKVLIVEDEMIERDSLKSMISTFDLDISKVETAQNGQEGLNLFRIFQPDIILADINMPKLSGLDMIEQIRKENKNVVCLVLTSYDYFSYAQRAIRLGVEDFILKPADKETVKKSITKAIEKLYRNKNTYIQTSSLVQKMNQIKSLLESECFYAILTRQDESKLIESFKMYGINVSSGICFVFNDKMLVSEIINNFRKDIEDIGNVCIQGNINEMTVLFVISNHQTTKADTEVLEQLIHTHKLKRYNYAVGGFKKDAVGLYTSYEEALYNLRSYGQDKKEVVYKDSEENLLISFADTWAKNFVDGIDNDEQELIKEFCQEVLQYEKDKINTVMNLVIHQMVDEIENKYNLLIEIDKIDTQVVNGNYQSMEITLTQMLNKILKPVKSIKYQNSSHLLKKAMKFIDKNYKKPISLNDLADELNVSSFYISKLFSKESGQNFTEIVNDMRIKEAKRLIKNDYSFKEVAYNVGFGSQSYFTKIFKKKVGMSPKEYRNMF